jgi:hypothetical protein
MSPIDRSACVFEPGKRGNDRRVPIMGLYPPPSATPNKQHANCTSQEIKNVMQHFNFDWVDLYPVAPPPGTKCTDVDLDAMQSYIQDQTIEAWQLVTAWYNRMEALVKREHDHGNPKPVVIWAGKPVNLARKWLAEHTKWLCGAYQFGTPWFRVVSTDRFVSMEGAVHPSAHLQAGNKPTARHLFQITYACLEALRHSPHTNADALLATVDNDTRVRHNDFIGALKTRWASHTSVAGLTPKCATCDLSLTGPTTNTWTP